MKKFLNILIFIFYFYLTSTENLCGNWESFKDGKCFKVMKEDIFMTYEEAVELCSQSESGSTLITIHSKEEQEFIEKYLFEIRNLGANVWLGLKNSNNKFEWIDKTSVEFTNWANGSPGKESDGNCVEMSSESSPIGKWVDIECSQRLSVVCERPPMIKIHDFKKILFETQDLLIQTRNELNKSQEQLNNTINDLSENIKQSNIISEQLRETQNLLNKTIIDLNDNRKQTDSNSDQLKETQNLLKNNEKQLLEIRNELNESREQLTEIRKQLVINPKNFNESQLKMSSKIHNWIHSNLFIDSDGKQRAFIFPVNENKDKVIWNNANNICIKYNATLVEINSQEKQNIFETFLKQLDTNLFNEFWLNARKVSSGKWKWLRSGNDITFTNWLNDRPNRFYDNDHLIAIVTQNSRLFGKWENIRRTYHTSIICELEVDL